MNIQFLGAAKTVTGSKHLITTEKGIRILLDCGFFQGSVQDADFKNRHLGFSPHEIDYLILSHAHIDHSGNIPNLVKQGYNNPIYATPATIDLCKIMLRDSAFIQENDLKHINKRRIKRGEDPIKPLYTVSDVDKAIKLFVPVPYDFLFQINDDISLIFTDSGHILGSAAVNLKIKESNEIKKICFTGDIGRYNGSILRDPQPIPSCNVLISESTYGNRLHSDQQMGQQDLLQIIHHTCVEKKGKLIIPAFSLGRTQELVYSLDRLENQGLLPKIPVFVDSPLSVNATNVMRKHNDCFNDEIKLYLEKDNDPFGFDKLIYIQDVEDSKKINTLKEPCIIISASGMVEAGRIKHHVANNIHDPKNTILMVGYAEPTSIGGRLRSGAKTIKIFGEEYPIKAEVIVLHSYSAHADYKEMIQYFSCLDKKQLEQIFLVHGEYESQLSFKEKLLDEGYRNITIPNLKESFEI
ncbi:MAG: MBL fold metallo-hydrolase [Flavobacteriia bacterium]|nr:MBL fold metallo-hydrolase [Flavobacteriia bacterium]